MTRLARRNKTRQIKLWKKRGFAYFRGAFWRRYGWKFHVVVGTSRRSDFLVVLA
jgi:hypothetical protein